MIKYLLKLLITLLKICNQVIKIQVEIQSFWLIFSRAVLIASMYIFCRGHLELHGSSDWSHDSKYSCDILVVLYFVYFEQIVADNFDNSHSKNSIWSEEGDQKKQHCPPLQHRDTN